MGHRDVVAVSGLQLCGGGQGLELEPGPGMGAGRAGVMRALDNETDLTAFLSLPPPPPPPVSLES